MLLKGKSRIDLEHIGNSVQTVKEKNDHHKNFNLIKNIHRTAAAKE